MEKDKKRIIIGAGILGGAGLLYLLTRKGGLPPPPPPPGDNYGCLQGYILDKNTSAKIPRGTVTITIDGIETIYNIIDELGGYRTPYLEYGTHQFSVQANDYQTEEFTLEISEPVAVFHFELEPLPPAPPGEWSEGVEVQKIFVEPETAYLGEIANINVYIQYGIHNPGAYPTPATIFGTVKVNGQTVKKEFNIDFRNPTLSFPYMASQVGEFTAIAQDKSTTFTVTESLAGIYYSPIGGSRFPICTELTIPGIAVLTSGKDFWGIERPSWGNHFVTWDLNIIDKLSEAYPSAWSPPQAIVRKWSMSFIKPFSGMLVPVYVFTMPTDYDCPPYWANKEELANALVATRGVEIPSYFFGSTGNQLDNWLSQFGANIALFVGYRDWERELRWGADGNLGWIYCPYCNQPTGHTAGPYTYSSPPRMEIARKLLGHIEQEHPDHPLTAPAWF